MEKSSVLPWPGREGWPCSSVWPQRHLSRSSGQEPRAHDVAAPSASEPLSPTPHHLAVPCVSSGNLCEDDASPSEPEGNHRCLPTSLLGTQQLQLSGAMGGTHCGAGHAHLCWPVAAVGNGLPTRHRGALASGSWADPVLINVRPTDMGPDTEKGPELASAPLPLAGVAASGQAPAGG